MYFSTANFTTSSGGQFWPQRRVVYDPQRGEIVDDLQATGGAGHEGVGQVMKR